MGKIDKRNVEKDCVEMDLVVFSLLVTKRNNE